MRAKLSRRDTGAFLCEVELQIQGPVTQAGAQFVALLAPSDAHVAADVEGALLFETETDVYEGFSQGGHVALAGMDASFSGILTPVGSR